MSELKLNNVLINIKALFICGYFIINFIKISFYIDKFIQYDIIKDDTTSKIK